MMHRFLFLLPLVAIFMLFAGCASSKPPTIFLPSDSPGIVAYFRSGVPIAAVEPESTFMLLSMQPVSIAGKEYICLWMLYKNTGTSPYLLEPLKIASLDVRGIKRSFTDIPPDTPSEILSHIDNEKAGKMIFEAVGGALQALSTEPTTLTSSSGEVVQVNDKGEKIRNVVNQTLSSMVVSSAWYDTYRNSINSGVLKRHTVFPGESVNGNIYFPAPTISTVSKGLVQINPKKYAFTFEILTPAGKRSVEFVPGEGE